MEWIKVTETLPDQKGFTTVLICKENKVVMEAMFNSKLKIFQNPNFSVLNHQVTHWMPLPEKPENE